VLSVEKSLFDFKFKRYFYISTIDVYESLGDPRRNQEETVVDPGKLHPYGFHKWLAERLVERFAKNPLILRVGTVLGEGMKKGPLWDLINNEPLHMAVESELSLIDTLTIKSAIAAFVAKPPAHLVINLTGTGAACLRTLCERLGLTWRLAPGAEQVRYRYNINNDRFRGIFPAPDSQEIAVRFLASALNLKL
jgi:nucleoside-diphosphate-sugar epimerase